MNISEYETEQNEIIGAVDTEDTVEVIGVSFKSAGKIYYFDPNGFRVKEKQHVIVDTARGYEYGRVTLANCRVPSAEIVPPLRKVTRIADKDDDERYVVNCEKEKEAFDICLKKIAEHELDMKLIDVEYTFDNAKLLFYFTSEERVDFRELVKDLASVFRTRIELRQIGLRDEAKIMGGFGICGREFCCHSFLGDFVQVSIKMAKEQNLSLNAAKISGACGRLMCCLRYEHEAYKEEYKKLPKVDQRVLTPDGEGVVTEISPLTGLVKVEFEKDGDTTVLVYDKSLIRTTDGKPVDPDSVSESEEKSAAKTKPQIPKPAKAQTQIPKSAEAKADNSVKEDAKDSSNEKNKDRVKENNAKQHTQKNKSHQAGQPRQKQNEQSKAKENAEQAEAEHQEKIQKKSQKKNNRYRRYNNHKGGKNNGNNKENTKN